MVGSPLWSVALPQDTKTQCVYQFYHAIKLVAVDSFSFGVWDTENQLKRPESASTGGRLNWDENNLNTTSEELLGQMDFPLVSVAVAYDGMNKPIMPVYDPIIDLMPLFGQLYQAVGKGDVRQPQEKQPKALGQVVFRAGTATRLDYAQYGLAKGLGHWLMKEAASQASRACKLELLMLLLRKSF